MAREKRKKVVLSIEQNLEGLNKRDKCDNEDNDAGTRQNGEKES
jgi:hypothetical protein